MTNSLLTNPEEMLSKINNVKFVDMRGENDPRL
jgi:hypothetical protein